MKTPVGPRLGRGISSRHFVARVSCLVMMSLAVAGGAWAHGDKKHPRGEKHADPPKAPSAHDHGTEDHDHESPHGGIVATIDKETHVEMKLTGAQLDLWFYDAHLKPIALPTDAKATVVVGKDVKKLELPIAKKSDGTLDDHLSVALAAAPAADQKIALVIQATLLGKSRTARVERKAGSAAASAPVNAPTPAPAPTSKGTP
jgi:hypothetical protein